MTGPVDPDRDDPNTVCGWMNCRHIRSEHDNIGGCSARVECYNEHLYGYHQPLIYKSCGCSWVEPVGQRPRSVRDEPQA